jgi:hypothetical protein
MLILSALLGGKNESLCAEAATITPFSIRRHLRDLLFAGQRHTLCIE